MESLAKLLGAPGQRQDARDRRGPNTLSGRDSRDVREASGRDSEDEKPLKLKVIEFTGGGRPAGPNTTSQPAGLRLDETGLTLKVGTGRPVRAGYRDLSMIAIEQSTAMISLGQGQGAMSWILDRFGDKLGPVVRELRERRLKQRLSDGLVDVPDEQAELVEFDWHPTTTGLGPGPDGPATPTGGVGQIVIHAWGFVVSPIDERLGWIHYRRGAIATVTQPAPGCVAIEGGPGTLTLRGLGAGATRLHDSLQKLRDGAFDDAAGFVEKLLPDAPFGVRQTASALLVDGRPTRPDELGAGGWPIIETALLGEPTFAESYRSLLSAAGDAAPRWAAMAPTAPGGEEPKMWFLIAMPGNLVAMELVSAGAHATYFYRVLPRAQYQGEPPEKLGLAAERAVRDISDALMDCRFLREPMALPEEQLRLPQYLRYRLALAVLPALAWARARFVARIVHRDPESWSKAVADLIRWHRSVKDEGAEWPGRGAEEALVAQGGEESGDDRGSAESEVPEAGSGDAGDAGKAGGKMSKPSGPRG
jgi:hypothetical protein